MNKSIFIVGLAALLMGGCAGSATLSGLTDPATNAVQGQAALDAALALPASSDPTQQLSDAVYKLNTAYSQEPTAERGAGLGIAMAAKAANDIATLFGTSLNRSRSTPVPSAVSKLTYLLNPWKRNGTTAALTPLDIVDLSGELSESSRAFPDNPTPAAVRSALVSTRDTITRAKIILYNSAVDIATGTYSVANPNGGGARVGIGRAELLALYAYLQEACVFIESALSFNIEFSSSQFSTTKTIDSEFSAQTDPNATISASRLLPTGFLSSASDAAANRKNALDCATEVYDYLKAAKKDVNERGPTGNGLQWLLSSVGITSTVLDNQNSEFSGLMKGTSPTSVNGVNTTIKLEQFLNVEGLSLQSFVPDFKISKSGANYTFTPVANSAKTAQVNMLFPNGVSYKQVTLAGSSTRIDAAQELLKSLTAN